MDELKTLVKLLTREVKREEVTVTGELAAPRVEEKSELEKSELEKANRAELDELVLKLELTSGLEEIEEEIC